MTHSDDKKLDAFLHKLEVPVEDKQKKDKQIETALAFFGQEAANLNHIATSSGSAQSRKRSSIAILAVAACFILLIAVGYNIYGNPDQSAPKEYQAVGTQIALNDMEADQILLQEINQLMGGQFAGIRIENDDINILPAERNYAANDTPVVLTIQRNGQREKIITFNGNQIPLNIDGKDITVDVLVSGKGDIILEGENFFWSKDLQSPLKKSLDINGQIMGQV